MNDKLTRNDIKKMEEEIEHRKLVIRKEALVQHFFDNHILYSSIF